MLSASRFLFLFTLNEDSILVVVVQLPERIASPLVLNDLSVDHAMGKGEELAWESRWDVGCDASHYTSKFEKLRCNFIELKCVKLLDQRLKSCLP